MDLSIAKAKTHTKNRQLEVLPLDTQPLCPLPSILQNPQTIQGSLAAPVRTLTLLKSWHVLSFHSSALPHVHGLRSHLAQAHQATWLRLWLPVHLQLQNSKTVEAALLAFHFSPSQNHTVLEDAPSQTWSLSWYPLWKRDLWFALQHLAP